MQLLTSREALLLSRDTSWYYKQELSERFCELHITEHEFNGNLFEVTNFPVTLEEVHYEIYSYAEMLEKYPEHLI